MSLFFWVYDTPDTITGREGLFFPAVVIFCLYIVLFFPFLICSFLIRRIFPAPARWNFVKRVVTFTDDVLNLLENKNFSASSYLRAVYDRTVDILTSLFPFIVLRRFSLNDRSPATRDYVKYHCAPL